ncbi:MAG: glycosyltransferase [Planctomycetota bacterium]
MRRSRDGDAQHVQVLLVGKYGLGAAAGDSVAVRGLIDRLAERGVDAEFTATPIQDSRGTPAVVHAMNADAPATAARALADRLGVPLVVTTTGTDLNEGLDDPQRRVRIVSNLRAAARVVTLTEAQTQSVRRHCPRADVTRIFQRVELEASDFDLRAAADLAPEAPYALMLGGFRPVKDQLFALVGWCGGAGVTLVMAGDLVDPLYGRGVHFRARATLGVKVLPALPHAHVGAALGAAFCLVNTSRSEGESRAILEAHACGCPVVARRNRGNEALVRDGIDGLLFDDPEGLHAAMERLREPGTRDRLAAGARAAAAAREALPRDDEVLAGLYRDLAAS